MSSKEHLPSQRSICGIVVTYHPDRLFGDRLRRIANQVANILVIDNASSENEKSFIKAACEDSNATLLCNQENLGIAAALNKGIKKAAELGYGWVILFDQDSIVNEDLVLRLCQIYDGLPDPQMVGVVSARYQNPAKKISPKKNFTSSWTTVKRTITSGSLIPISLFTDIGAFRDDFFIDYVDLEFCQRLREKGFSIIKSTETLMSHPVGQQTFHRFLWKKIRSTHHSSDRRYYIARNHIAMLRGQKNRPYLWLYPCLKKACGDACIVLFFESNKLEKIKAILEGIKDGLAQKMGKRSVT